MRARSVLSFMLALVLLAQPTLVGMPAASAETDEPTRSGDVLTITDLYVINDRQEWNLVVVKGTGTLRVAQDGVLICSIMDLERGSDLHIDGGTLTVWNDDPLDTTNIHGSPDEVLVTNGGLMMMEGRSGDTVYSNGKGGRITLDVQKRVLIEDSQVYILGGAGQSPEVPVSSSDIEDQFEGGYSSASISIGDRGQGISIIRSSMVLEGGNGGDAPDGRAPDGELGGMAGGYTAGGNVSGSVGAGGHAFLTLSGPRVSVVSSLIDVGGGDGGDAGDGGPAGRLAGGGGGGYSGGKGAGSDGPAGSGGAISSEVGLGGNGDLDITALDISIEGSDILVTGGDGGDAGNGGDADPSRPDAILSGGGGGGYSGGGGGASGISAGTDGGHGSNVTGMVGSGGDAFMDLWTPNSRIRASHLLTTGGSGGRGGNAGTSTRGVGDWDWRAGGGGGSYSAGGGGGTSSTSWTSGAGGTGGPVNGPVATGGNAMLDLNITNATISANATIRTTAGDRGDCIRSDAPGAPGGEGRGLITTDGHLRERIPMSSVELLSPDDGAVSSTIPTFNWGRAHNASSAGRVLRYEFQLDDDPEFSSPEMGVTISTNELEPGWLPNFTNYWRVRALYERPWLVPGPWSQHRAITYINLPPEIGYIPPVEVLVSEIVVVDLSPYITDPDDAIGHLSIRPLQNNIIEVSRLNLTLHFPDELGTVIINFTVSDGLNEVDGEFIAIVTRYRHPPFILGVTNHRPPLELVLFEGTDAMYDIKVHDVDSTQFNYWVNGSWRGANAYANGTLRVRAAIGEVGFHEFILYVSDEGGREASIKVKVNVLNVNDPPDPPRILSPNKRITVREGDLVSFSALVNDPDLRHGQVLNVTFVSNETGVLRTMQTTGAASVSSSSLPVGQHVVTVVVSDGQYSSSDQVVVTVEAPPVPPPVKTAQADGIPMWVYLVASIVLFAVGFTGGHLHRRRMSRNGPDIDS